MSVAERVPSLSLPTGLTIQAETPFHARAVDQLFDAAFGPGRFAKTAERLREGNSPSLNTSYVAMLDNRIVAAGRMWPIRIGATEAAFFGPFAVDEAQRHHGLGRIILEHCIAAAKQAGDKIILLVGGASYFVPSGFVEVEANRLLMPGPVDPKRLLWLALAPDALAGVEGVVSVPRAARP